MGKLGNKATVRDVSVTQSVTQPQSGIFQASTPYGCASQHSNSCIPKKCLRTLVLNTYLSILLHNYLCILLTIFAHPCILLYTPAYSRLLLSILLHTQGSFFEYSCILLHTTGANGPIPGRPHHMFLSSNSQHAHPRGIQWLLKGREGDGAPTQGVLYHSRVGPT